MASFRKSLCTGICLVATVFFGGGIALCEVLEPTAPADLRLNDAEDARSRALAHFAWGLYLQMAGNRPPREFLDHYRSALELAPDSEVIFEHLVTPWLMQNKHDRIAETLAPIAADNPFVSHLQSAYTEALLAQQKFDEAASHLEKLLEASGWCDVDHLRQLFVCYWRLGRYDDVQVLLRDARQRPDFSGHFMVEHAAAIFYRALLDVESEAEKGQAHLADLRARSLRHARQAAGLWREAERAVDIQTLGGLFLESHAPEEAMLFFRKVRTEERFRTPKIGILLAQALQQSGQVDDALALVEELLATELENPYGYVELGMFYLELDMPAAAARMFARALVAVPRALEVRLRLAYIHLELDQPKQAMAVMAPVRELPARGHLLVAHIYRRLGRTELALLAAKRAETAAKEQDAAIIDADFRLFCATLCDDLGRADEAIAQARLALELDPESPTCANFLGYVLADHDRELDYAERLILAATDAEPGNVAYRDSLAWVYYMQERWPEALREINRTLQLGGQEMDSVILDHAGDIYAANGYAILARHYWRLALASEPLRPEMIREKLASGAVSKGVADDGAQ